MVRTTPAVDFSKELMSGAEHSSMSGRNRLLQWSFCLWVLALALYQFSENTADPDLWAHTMFGEHLLLTGKPQKLEQYSWTARGEPFVNHEAYGDAILGAAHRLAGGSGLLLLKVAVGFLTFGLALRLGGERMPWPQKAFAWAVGAIAVVEISFGFAARPQIFTALAIACELWLVRRVHDGKLLWAAALPLLFVVWINIHGGALAGIVVLLVIAGASTAQFAVERLVEAARRFCNGAVVPRNTCLVLLAACAGCIGALFLNSWGPGLIRWLIGSVLWLRPEIEEWNPTRFGWDHAGVFVLILVAAVSFALSRRPRFLWEIAVCAVLGFFAVRSVRHTPLFSIAALALVPPHLADVSARYQDSFARLHELFRRGAARTFLAAFFGLTSLAIVAATFTLHKEHPLTMEVPRRQYPVAAVGFMRDHGINGNLLVFFDWGEMCLWELPDCAVSIDGRLDTCYPRELIAEHWRFYNGDPVNRRILDLEKADAALLPSNLAGALALAKMPGWEPAYVDPLAAVLVKNPQRFSGLAREHLPVQGSAGATIGRVPFPATPSERIKR